MLIYILPSPVLSATYFSCRVEEPSGFKTLITPCSSFPFVFWEDLACGMEALLEPTSFFHRGNSSSSNKTTGPGAIAIKIRFFWSVSIIKHTEKPFSWTLTTWKQLYIILWLCHEDKFAFYEWLKLIKTFNLIVGRVCNWLNAIITF